MEENHQKTKYLISIIPLTRISLMRDQFFYYLSDRFLPVGSLCEIPFGHWKVKGVVLESKLDFDRAGGMELKKIEKVLMESFLTEKQLKLAQFVSNYYLCSLGVVLKHFLPTPTKSRKKPTENFQTLKKSQIPRHCEESINEAIPINYHKLSEEQENFNEIATLHKFFSKNFIPFAMTDFITEILKSERKNFILQVNLGDQKNDFLINLINKFLQKNENSQVLYLLPEVAQTLEMEKKLNDFFGTEKLAILHSKLTKGTFFENWEKIRTGKAKIIMGTRMAIFAPFQNLSAIITDNHTDISYKQWDMNPRYDTRNLTQKLSELFDCPNLSVSTFPCVTDYFFANLSLSKKATLSSCYCEERNDEAIPINFLKLSEVHKNSNEIATLHKIFSKNFIPFAMTDSTDFTEILENKSKTLLKVENQTKILPKINIVDLKKDRWNKRFSSISQELEFKLRNVLNGKKQALLFINRQGLSAFSICLKCKTPLKCPQCERALIGKNNGTFNCLHCNFATDIFPKCSSCFSLEFKNLGMGTEKIEKELQKTFPKAKIKRVDQSVKKFSDLQKIYQDFSSGEIDILIGTQMILEGWNSSNLTLTAILDFDNLTSLPEYNAQEKTMAFSLNLYQKVVGKKNSEFLIQTFNEFNPIFEAIKKSDFTEIYEEELKIRQTLNYPPFAQIVKLVYQSTDENETQRYCQLFYEKIAEKTQENKNVKIIPPHFPLLNKIRTKYRQQIIIKCKEKELPKILTDEIKKLDKNWIIDVDPISLI